jgi:hypothetical protein
MKKLLACFGAFIPFALFSQSLSPTVVASSGDYFSAGSTTLSWTLGEIATDTYIGSSNQLTQGFHQPDSKFALIDDIVPDFHISLYPNPTSGLVTIEADNYTGTLRIEILDLTGKIIYSTGSLENTNSVYQVDVSGYSRGIYFMQIFDGENQKIKTFKLEKL